MRMNLDPSLHPKTDAARTGRDGGGAGITAIAVIAALLVGMIGIFDVAAGAAPQIGQAAPDFTAVDSKGDPIRLSEYRGQIVVLEWTNADCPYTRKHYSSGNMQSVQALAQKNGIVWLSVISSAPGKLGLVNGAAADALTLPLSVALVAFVAAVASPPGAGLLPPKPIPAPPAPPVALAVRL